ncbi:MAG: ATP-binding protein [Caldanaerobacter subterraneus]|nr:ATP-binding protein [Caldanaerobacter subterraneus]
MCFSFTNMRVQDFPKMLLIAFTTAFLGQIYIFPFGTSFRVGIGVIVFVVLLLYFSEVSIFFTALLTSVIVPIFRILLDIAFNQLPWTEAFSHHFPTSIYYIAFGSIFRRFHSTNPSDNLLYFVVYLGIIDTLSNCAELLVRTFTKEIPLQFFDDAIPFIAAVGFSRGLIILLLYWLLQKYTSMILEKIEKERYLRFLVLTLNLKNELYFLVRAADKIEKVMRKSYEVYSLLSSERETEQIKEELKDKALELAVDMHEIKKDYFQVKGRIEKLLPDVDVTEAIEIREIMEFLKKLSLEYAESLNKTVNIRFESKLNFKTDKYAYLFPLLNELIQNAIEAIDKEIGVIEVELSQDGEDVIFKVKDNGEGIKPKNLETIFEPGFSTKFDKNTGKMSSGLGLCQVKRLVEILKGEISLHSELAKGTVFTVKIPKEMLIKK